MQEVLGGQVRGRGGHASTGPATQGGPRPGDTGLSWKGKLGSSWKVGDRILEQGFQLSVCS